MDMLSVFHDRTHWWSHPNSHFIELLKASMYRKISSLLKWQSCPYTRPKFIRLCALWWSSTIRTMMKLNVIQMLIFHGIFRILYHWCDVSIQNIWRNLARYFYTVRVNVHPINHLFDHPDRIIAQAFDIKCLTHFTLNLLNDPTVGDIFTAVLLKITCSVWQISVLNIISWCVI